MFDVSEAVRTARAWMKRRVESGPRPFRHVYSRRSHLCLLPRVSALVFYPTHAWQTLTKYAGFGLYALNGVRMRYRVQADPLAKVYSDLAITPVIDAEDEALEMFALGDRTPARARAMEEQ